MRALFDAGYSSASSERGTSVPTSIGVARPDAKAVEGGGIIRVGDDSNPASGGTTPSLEVPWKSNGADAFVSGTCSIGVGGMPFTASVSSSKYGCNLNFSGCTLPGGNAGDLRCWRQNTLWYHQL